MGLTLDGLKASLHNVEIQNAAGDALAIDASGKLTAIVEDGGGSLTVDGTVAATQSGTWTVNQGGAWTVAATQSGTWTIDSITNVVSVDDNGGSLTVDGTVAATQSGTWTVGFSSGSAVEITDGTDTLAVNADGSINVQGSVTTSPGGYSSWDVQVETVTTSAAEIASTPLGSRLGLIVQNRGNKDIFVGPTALKATPAAGFEIPKGASLEIMLDDGADLYASTSSSSSDVRILEFAV